MEIINNFINIDNISIFIASWLSLVAIVLVLFLLFRFRSFIINFIRTTRLELSKVEWLSKKETRNYTIINIIFIIAMTVLIFSLDQTFLFVRNLLI